MGKNRQDKHESKLLQKPQEKETKEKKKEKRKMRAWGGGKKKSL